MDTDIFRLTGYPLAVSLVFLCFVCSVLVSAGYCLYFFRRLAFYREPSPADAPAAPPGVSVIVCAWNELDNLRDLLPVLLAQDYPKYEIILVDDRSDDACYDYLLFESFKHTRLHLVRVNETPDHVAAKKYALTLGIKAAQYGVVLLTDADCRPDSNQWIARMTAPMRQSAEVVLGFSPYRYQPGLLNFLIRHETFHTAVQYLSFALSGVPYMGVGRNLCYAKPLFIQNKGFRSHLRIVGGDDDLFVAEVANRRNTTVCLQPEAFVYSEPKQTFRAWLRQKRRHLAVGKKYSVRNKALLGMLSASHVLFWSCGILLLALQAFVPFVAAGMGLRLGLQTWLLARAARRLDSRIRWYTLPVFDFLFVPYYLIAGTWALFTKRASWS